MATIPLFRSLKARKALYGFECRISSNTFIPIGEAVTQALRVDPDLLFQVEVGMSNSVKVYTNHESAAHVIGEAVYEG